MRNLILQLWKMPQSCDFFSGEEVFSLSENRREDVFRISFVHRRHIKYYLILMIFEVIEIFQKCEYFRSCEGLRA